MDITYLHRSMQLLGFGCACKSTNAYVHTVSVCLFPGQWRSYIPYSYTQGKDFPLWLHPFSRPLICLSAPLPCSLFMSVCPLLRLYVCHLPCVSLCSGLSLCLSPCPPLCGNMVDKQGDELPKLFTLSSWAAMLSSLEFLHDVLSKVTA